MVKLKNEIKKMIFTYRKQNHTIKEIIYLLSEELDVKVSASTISRVLKEKLEGKKENEEEDEKEEKNEDEKKEEEEDEETADEDEETKEEEEEEETEKNNNSIIELLNKWKNEELIIKEEPPKLNIKPLYNNRKNNKNKNNDDEYDINDNNNNILDTLKNVNSGNIDELKLKRSNIIIIRQYLNTFKNDLTGIYGKDIKGFQKKLFSFNNDQLLIILENIRVE